MIERPKTASNTLLPHLATAGAINRYDIIVAAQIKVFRANRYGSGRCRIRRFPHRVLHHGWPHGLVPVLARLADCGFTRFRPPGISRKHRPRVVDRFAQCEVSGFSAIIPFIVQFGMYVSPVGFSSNIVPEQWRLLYSLNPMVGVIDGFRWCLLGGQSELFPLGQLAGGIVTAFFLWFGLRQFRKTERSFADLI